MNGESIDYVLPTAIYTREATTTEMQESLVASFEAFEHADGEEMRQIWNPAFVVFAYLLAFVSSYSAVHLLDHGLWRPDEMKNRNGVMKHPDLYAAALLGFGPVWCMHFVSEKRNQNEREVRFLF